MPFNVGDEVQLGKDNGSSAFSSLRPGQKYSIENLGTKCSHCGIQGQAGASVKVLGVYYCAASFVAYAQQKVQGGSGGSGRDPARDLYNGSVEFWDTLPDATHEDYKTLPTLEQLYEREKAAREKRK